MRQTISIHDGWRFTKALQATPPNTLPHPGGGGGGIESGRGACWYCRALDIPAPEDGRRVYFEIQGAGSVREAYLNGQKLACHAGGFSIFRAELTPHLKAEGENLLAVLAVNGTDDMISPDLEDFTLFGGLWRKASLIIVPESHFGLDPCGAPGLRVTPLRKDGAAEIALEAHPAHARDGQTLLFEIYDGANACVARTQADVHQGRASIRLENPRLWDGVDDPYLYKACAKLMEDGLELDSICARFGVRSFEVRPDTGFYLNGRPYPLHGVSHHQNRLDSGGREHEEDMRRIREVGANTIRLVHEMHDRYFYDLCDEAGMVVWAELPFTSMPLTTPGAQEDTLGWLRELVAQGCNHPCICFWGITINGESDAPPDSLRARNSLMQALDRTRLTAMAGVSTPENDSPLDRITDVIACNYDLGSVEGDAPLLDAFHAAHPALCLGVSACGCAGIPALHGSEPSERDSSGESLASNHEKMLETSAARPYLWGVYAGSMFDSGRDMRGEGGVKGLVTFDRRTRRDSFYLCKAYWTQEPFVHICSRRPEERAGETTRVKVYSNCEQVTLKVNGKRIDRVNGRCVFSFDRVPLTMGENIIEAAGFRGQQEVCWESALLVRAAEPKS